MLKFHTVAEAADAMPSTAQPALPRLHRTLTHLIQSLEQIAKSAVANEVSALLPLLTPRGHLEFFLMWIEYDDSEQVWGSIDGFGFGQITALAAFFNDHKHSNDLNADIRELIDAIGEIMDEEHGSDCTSDQQHLDRLLANCRSLQTQLAQRASNENFDKFDRHLATQGALNLIKLGVLYGWDYIDHVLDQVAALRGLKLAAYLNQNLNTTCKKLNRYIAAFERRQVEAPVKLEISQPLPVGFDPEDPFDGIPIT